MTPILPNLAVCILSYQLQLKTALINSGNDEDSESSIRKNKQHQSASRGHRIHPEAIKMWNSFGYQNYATDPVGRAYSASYTWWEGWLLLFKNLTPLLVIRASRDSELRDSNSGYPISVSSVFTPFRPVMLTRTWTCKDKDLTHKDQDKART